MIRTLEEARELMDQFAKKISKDKLRFTICADNEKHSGTWAAWGNGSDFYIGARSILGSVKISLHASGICRVALTEAQMALLLEKGLPLPTDRAFIKWRRKPTPERGVAHVVSLVFPTSYFRLPAPVSSSKKPILVLGAQPGWKAVEVGFFYSREPADMLEERFVRFGNPLFHVNLDDGDSISIVARETTFDPAVLPTSDMFNKGVTHLLTQGRLELGTERSNLTAAFFNGPKDGELLQVVEVGGVTMRRNPNSA